MKKLMSMVLALVMCLSLAVTASAVDVSGSTNNAGAYSYTLDFAGKELAATELTFRGFDSAQGKAVPEVREVQAVALNVGDQITLVSSEVEIPGEGNGIEVSCQLYMWEPSDVGYTPIISFGLTYQMKNGIAVPDPTNPNTLPELRSLQATGVVLGNNSKYIIEICVGCYNMWGMGEDLATYYVIINGIGSSGATETPDEPVAPAEPETPTKPEVPTESETPAEPTAPATPAPAGSYTVKKGDTYGTIALNNYGTYGVWNALAKANNYAKLTADTQLVLPEKLGKYERIEAPVAAEGETLYTVQVGDTLGAIAKTVYGDVMQYKAIFERNADRLVNADTIYKGQVIVLPAK